MQSTDIPAAPGTDLATYGGHLDGYRPQVMTPEVAKALDEQVRLCTKAVLREGTDYGIIPGTGGGKSLWRPGAQKLLQWFQLGIDCKRVEVERDDDGRKHGITYRAEVFRQLPDGTRQLLATCEGTADYDESKFYQSAEQVKARLRAQEQKWAEKDHRRPNPERWMNATEYRADWNALMKRAQKRAIVGATVDATAAGGIFADREDDEPPVPQVLQDDEPSWYEQALEQALTFTTQEDGRRLYAEAAHAGRDGAASRRQVDHVQNRVRQRAERLKSRIQVSVEDLTDVPPAEASYSAAAAARPAEPAGGTPERPPALITSGQKTTLDKERQRLGYGDSEQDWDDWLHDLAALARIAAIAAPAELTQAEAKDVIDRLKKCDSRKDVDKLLATGEQASG
jgi:hypothetical protein